MNRRRYLGTVVAGAASGLAGCSGFVHRPGTATAPEGSEQPSPTPIARLGDVSLPVPATEMRSAVPRDYIPAIETPAFADDWDDLTLPEDSRGTSTSLPDSEAVVGVTHDGRARAYPLRVLDWHEVVNDDFGGPLLVTYCVICGSSVVVDREVAGAATVFGVSGLLWRRDLVLYDRATDSRWSQLLATAIRGPATGDRLAFRESTLTSWGEWRGTHPETEVLLPPPHSTPIAGYDRSFDYFTGKYGYAEETPLIGFDSPDSEVHSRTFVVGVVHGGHARAYVFDAVADAGVVNDSIGGLPVVVAVTPGETLVAYDRRVDGTTLRFSAVDDDTEFIRAGGSRWRRTTGEAVDGPHEGVQLRRANELPPMFWTGWVNFHPDSTVYTRSGITTPESP